MLNFLFFLPPIAEPKMTIASDKLESIRQQVQFHLDHEEQKRLSPVQERELKEGTKVTRGRIEVALMTSNRYIADVLEQARETLLAFVDRIAFIGFVPRGFADPIGFLDREHYRQTVTYGVLRTLAADPNRASAKDDAKAVLTSLTEHLALHIRDEEEDLFPALDRHCAGEEMFERTRALLSKEHETDHALSAALEGDLRALSEGKPLADAANFRAKALAFAELQERHLAWENDVILPMAQSRLSKEEVERLGRAMAARRGIRYPV